MSINKWVDKEDVVYIHNEYYSAIKKEQNNAICSNMDGPRDDHTEWSKPDRERQIYHLHIESKKIIQMNLFTKQVNTTL